MHISVFEAHLRLVGEYQISKVLELQEIIIWGMLYSLNINLISTATPELVDLIIFPVALIVSFESGKVKVIATF
jgi:hypothetical protein